MLAQSAHAFAPARPKRGQMSDLIPAAAARSVRSVSPRAVGYTVFSEWLNVRVRRSWAYAELMPVLPVVGTGLSPLLQRIVIAGLALVLARKLHRPASARSLEDPQRWNAR